MKKINTKIVTIAMLLLTFLAAGGIYTKEAITPGNGGWTPDADPEG
ncbi:MAG TPA: hypothetical protein VMX55_15340 [candidate division Zixibacteria bacterium]|nr:hypothetical protein [candidate division Zixibacteria bacterium]